MHRIYECLSSTAAQAAQKKFMAREAAGGWSTAAQAAQKLPAPRLGCVFGDNYLGRRIDSAYLLPVLTYCLT